MLTRPNRMLGIAVISLGLLASAAWAGTWGNPDHPSYAGPAPAPPTWFANLVDNDNTNDPTLAASNLNGAMDAEFTGGLVDSWVYYIAGSDASSGLGFVYYYHFPQAYAGPPLQRSTFDPEDWQTATNTLVAQAGWDGSGASTAVPGGGSGWTDGDPASISTVLGYPGIDWIEAGVGTKFLAGDDSSLIYFHCPDARSWRMGSCAVIDGNKVAHAPVLVAPLPGAALLGAVGLGAVGLLHWSRRRRGEA